MEIGSYVAYVLFGLFWGQFDVPLVLKNIRNIKGHAHSY